MIISAELPIPPPRTWSRIVMRTPSATLVEAPSDWGPTDGRFLGDALVNRRIDVALIPLRMPVS